MNTYKLRIIGTGELTGNLQALSLGLFRFLDRPDSLEREKLSRFQQVELVDPNGATIIVDIVVDRIEFADSNFYVYLMDKAALPTTKPAPQVLQQTWQTTGEMCPKCGDHLIANHKGEECSAYACTYVKAKK